MVDALHRLMTDENGQDLIEYGLVAGFVSLICYLAIKATGESVSTLWSVVETKVADAVSLM